MKIHDLIKEKYKTLTKSEKKNCELYSHAS